jgi:parvulin-like peptidyl-prolyl isomerase
MKYLVLTVGLFLLLSCSLNDGNCQFVKASHILLRAESKEEVTKARILADSIINRINRGESFEAMARKYGTDGTKDKGGDLGWFERGVMVKPFDDACFKAKDDKPFQVTTQFGVHVVKVTDRKISPCNQ